MKTTEDSLGWSRATLAGLLGLVTFWVVKVYTTWAAWGNVTIDSGREMYVPWVLSQGKMLYRDVWFLYTPAAPYLNGYLFRVFGPRLEVLYWAGSLAALGSAIFLYLTGIRLSSSIIGWTAGAVVLAEAFQPSLFCFPLPYSFSAVYGCLVACIFLWLSVNAVMASASGGLWMLGAGTAAAAALLTKTEFGMACYATLVLLIATRVFLQESWKSLAKDFLAISPGLILCVLVIRWMVSIRGVEFITQENIMSWPTAFFMKKYGKMWLEYNGFTISLAAFRGAAIRALPLAALAAVMYWVCSLRLRMLAIAIILVWLVRWHYSQSTDAPLEEVFSHLIFPQDMVLYVVFATLGAWFYFWRQRHAGAEARWSAATALALSFSAALAFRILMKMDSYGYAIYYNGPTVLSFLLLATAIASRRFSTRGVQLAAVVVICLTCLGFVSVRCALDELWAEEFAPLRTERGTIRMVKLKAKNYETAINFLKEKAARGDAVLSIPEDTSLYFLSGTYCPTRVMLFCPGVLAPGKMTQETIREIEKKQVRYLLWSNRTFPEYGVPIFGEDFDQEVGDYLRSHYRCVGPLTQNADPLQDWTATVWERRPDVETLKTPRVLRGFRTKREPVSSSREPYY